MSTPAVAFRDLPEKAFPFYVVGYDADTGEPLHWNYVTGPGVLHVPGKPEGVREVNVFMRFADGTEIDQ